MPRHVRPRVLAPTRIRLYICAGNDSPAPSPLASGPLCCPSSRDLRGGDRAVVPPLLEDDLAVACVRDEVVGADGSPLRLGPLIRSSIADRSSALDPSSAMLRCGAARGRVIRGQKVMAISEHARALRAQALQRLLDRG